MEKDKFIFKLQTEVPSMPLNEYLLKYKSTGDIAYLHYFLHKYEPKLNAIIGNFAFNYSIDYFFDDLKMVYVATLFELLRSWDTEKDSVFLYSNKFALRDSLIKFLSDMGGAFAVSSHSHFRALRKVAFLYFNTPTLHSEELYSYIADKTSLPVDTVRKLVAEATLFGGCEDILTMNEDNERCCNIPTSENVELQVENDIFIDHIIDIIDVLPFKEREIFIKSIGIGCHWCLRSCTRQTYLELANRFQLSGESAAEKLNKKARLSILESLADKGLIDFVSATKKNESKKSATYAYLPHNDKSADKGFIVIDKSDFNFKVESIADLDTMLSTRYAKRVVRYLKEKKDFPENILFVWKV